MNMTERDYSEIENDVTVCLGCGRKFPGNKTADEYGSNYCCGDCNRSNPCTIDHTSSTEVIEDKEYFDLTKMVKSKTHPIVFINGLKATGKGNLIECLYDDFKDGYPDSYASKIVYMEQLLSPNARSDHITTICKSIDLRESMMHSSITFIRHFIPMNVPQFTAISDRLDTKYYASRLFDNWLEDAFFIILTLPTNPLYLKALQDFLPPQFYRILVRNTKIIRDRNSIDKFYPSAVVYYYSNNQWVFDSFKLPELRK